MTNALKSHGTQLQMGDGDPNNEQFTTVAGVGDIKGPERSRDTIDVTAHDSPDDYEEFISGNKQNGDVTLPLFWDPTDLAHQAIDAAFEDGLVRNWRIIATDVGETYLPFAALVSKLGLEFPVNGVIKQDVSFKPTGVVAPVWTPAGSGSGA